MGAGDCHEVSIKYLNNIDRNDTRLKGKGVPLRSSKEVREGIKNGTIVLVQFEREMFSEFCLHTLLHT